jgi:sulfotransferase
MVSDDTFFLSQLDTAFETSYGHLASAMQGFLQGWHHDATTAVVVDKNRAGCTLSSCCCTSNPTRA